MSIERQPIEDVHAHMLEITAKHPDSTGVGVNLGECDGQRAFMAVAITTEVNGEPVTAAAMLRAAKDTGALSRMLCVAGIKACLTARRSFCREGGAPDH